MHDKALRDSRINFDWTGDADKILNLIFYFDAVRNNCKIIFRNIQSSIMLKIKIIF